MSYQRRAERNAKGLIAAAVGAAIALAGFYGLLNGDGVWRNTINGAIVAVGVTVAVPVAVGVGVAVAVPVGVTDGEGETVAVPVAVAVAVAVGHGTDAGKDSAVVTDDPSRPATSTANTAIRSATNPRFVTSRVLRSAMTASCLG
jgi:hypothetical protein